MTTLPQRWQRVRARVPVRVRGMSAEHRFFDETTETRAVGPEHAVLFLQNLVDLETDLHVTSVHSGLGGTFRVVWVNSLRRAGVYTLGLELADAEGELWQGIEGEPEAAGESFALECSRCGAQAEGAIAEASAEDVDAGFLIARPCEKCKATTAWQLPAATPLVDQSGEAADMAAARAADAATQDQRRKGRAPISLRIKIIRKKYGTSLEDVCETVNVSRGGALFLSSQIYEKGEGVEIILPYEEGATDIPVAARVVRRDVQAGSQLHAVAIQLVEPRKEA